ncbi:hypothetical protein E4U37_000484 [Claviceps purpurea]|nr:hypothetical protein E4U37_000484 [Claviceps purpurea]
MREKKKRGKASRKDLAERAAAQAAAVGGSTSHGDVSDGKESSHSPITDERGEHYLDNTKSDSMSTTSLATTAHDNGISDNAAIEPEYHHGQSSTSTPGPYGEIPDHSHMQHPIHITSDGMHDGRSMNMGGYANMSTSYDRSSLASDDLMVGGQGYTTHAHQSNMHHYPDMSFGMMSQSPTDFHHHAGNFRMSGSPMGGYRPLSAAASPAWAMPISSPPTSQFPPPMHGNDFGQNVLRYPVLQPLLPHLANIIPARLACDLIDFYFAASSSAAMHPMSPYILGSVFRKRAICHPTRPRKCQPALLASMLWVAAQTSEAPLLTNVPSARSKICQKLLELTISLLKPLIHSSSAPPSTNSDNSPTSAGTAMTPLGAVLPGSVGSFDAALSGQTDTFRAASQLDDLVTYIHLATVVSASEYKGSSLRWWNVAWSLARELKLGRELPPSEARSGFDQREMDSDGLDEHDRTRNTPGVVTEEEREERRRVWWLVYIVDRHLALCYNRPLFLLDVECEGLRQPLDDSAWQNGDFRPRAADSGGHTVNPGNNDMMSMLSEGEDSARPSSSENQFEFRGYSIYGFFLPLMMILGEIVDLHHARNHPRFGPAFRASGESSVQVAEIRGHLETYEESLKRFESRGTLQTSDGTRGGESGGLRGYVEAHRAMESNRSPSAHSVHTSSSRITEAEVQSRTMLAYGTHVMHVLHILLEGRWDPVSLLDDEEMWLASPDFAKASGHAVAAAEAIGQILEYDPGLELMPFFFGVYLLQGSFLLLLMADKLQGEAAPSVVRACETVVRAHDACVATLSTDYQQRKFSKVMRGALALVRGRIPEDLGEQLQRRRELLSLYRWTGDGTGLAL